MQLYLCDVPQKLSLCANCQGSPPLGWGRTCVGRPSTRISSPSVHGGTSAMAGVKLGPCHGGGPRLGRRLGLLLPRGQLRLRLCRRLRRCDLLPWQPRAFSRAGSLGGRGFCAPCSAYTASFLIGDLGALARGAHSGLGRCCRRCRLLCRRLRRGRHRDRAPNRVWLLVWPSGRLHEHIDWGAEETPQGSLRS